MGIKKPRDLELKNLTAYCEECSAERQNPRGMCSLLRFTPPDRKNLFNSHRLREWRMNALSMDPSGT